MGPQVQAAGLVPVVEPEILIDGDHDIVRFREVTEHVVAEVVNQMWHKVGGVRVCVQHAFVCASAQHTFVFASVHVCMLLRVPLLGNAQVWAWLGVGVWARGWMCKQGHTFSCMRVRARRVCMHMAFDLCVQFSLLITGCLLERMAPSLCMLHVNAPVQGVFLEGALLKPQMVIPGTTCPSGKASPQEVAHHTVTAMRRCGGQHTVTAMRRCGSHVRLCCPGVSSDCKALSRACLVWCTLCAGSCPRPCQASCS